MLTTSKAAVRTAVASVVFAVSIGPAVLAAPGAAGAPAGGGVGAVGRLEPKHDVIRVAGPSEVVLVLSQVLVDDGDPVKAGQIIARLDDFAVKEAAVAQAQATIIARNADVLRMEATLKIVRRDLERAESLASQQITTSSDLDRARLDVEIAEANLASARAQVTVAKAALRMTQVDLERRNIRSPVTGRVLKVHVREGEKVTSEGFADVGRTDEMYAVAEVYETDIARIHVGQRAHIRSAVLPKELTGTVERIAMQIGRKGIFEDSPSADRDVRVVEVLVKLDESAVAAHFTKLQVEVRFDP